MAAGKIVPKCDLTQEALKELLHYNPLTGEFTWIKLTAPGRAKVGDLAGSPDDRGYVVIGVKQRIYKRHRLAWLYMTGEWPKRFIDHIDRVPGNDEWANLREADDVENQQNVKIATTNKSGCVGVCWNRQQERWFAYIMNAKKRIHLGSFKNFDDAVVARKLAEAKLFGQYAPIRAA